MVVDKPEEAMKVFREADELTLDRDVILLELSNQPGSLGRVAGTLAAAGVNLEYAYCAGGPAAWTKASSSCEWTIQKRR